MKNPNWRIWIKDKNENKIWLNKYLKKKILKKSEDESKIYLKKTNHNLNLANWLLEKHKEFTEDKYYDWIITIYYYSIYHAALALLNKEGYNSKNHSATLCFLIYHNYHLQKALNKEDVELVVNSLNKEDIEIIGSSKELREKACYNIHTSFEKELTNQIKEQTINFINKIKSLLE